MCVRLTLCVYLAALTGEQSVVVAGDSISTHRTAPLDLPALGLSLQVLSWEMLPQINTNKIEHRYCKHEENNNSSSVNKVTFNKT